MILRTRTSKPLSLEAAMHRLLALILVAALSSVCSAAPPMVLKPARVFDGVAAKPQEGWIVVVQGERIVAAGPANEIETPKDARIIELPKMTLLPGLIDAHSHLLLHPYNEASWNDQVLKEPVSLRVSRAATHARGSLLAGF